MPDTIRFTADDVDAPAAAGPIHFTADDVDQEPAIGYRGVLRSVVSPKAKSDIVRRISGGLEIGAKEAAPTVGEAIEEAKAAPLRTAGSLALGLTGIPSIIEWAKTLAEAGPDVARNLVHEPVATIRGAAAGTAEGITDLLTPANMVLAALGKRAGMRGPKIEEPIVDRYMPNTGAPPPPPGAPAVSKYGKFTTVEQPAPGPSTSRIPIRTPDVSAPVERGRLVPRQTPTPEEAIQQALDAVRQPEPPTATTLPRTDQAPVATASAAETRARMAAQGRAPAAPETPSAPSLAKVEQVAAPKFEAGDAAGAADAIEKMMRSPRTVQEIAQDLRDLYGSERAGGMLNPENPRAGAEQIRRLSVRREGEPLKAQGARLDKNAERALDLDDMRDLRLARQGKLDPEALSPDLRRLLNEQGGRIPTKLLAAGGGALAGGAVGGTVGDDADDRATNALIGAGVGTVLPLFIAHASAVGKAKALQDYTFGSVLSSPQSVLKAWMGAAGGAVSAAMEKIAAGNLRDGQAILSRLFSTATSQQFMKALKDPKTASVGMAAGDAPSIIGRIFGAMDAAVRPALQAGGVSTEDAARYMLSGAPSSSLGQGTLALLSRHFVARLATSLFPRVGIQVLERGLERLPIGLKNTERLGVATRGTRAERLARQAIGTGVAVGAYEGNDQIPGWAKPFVVALSGVYALPATLGMSAAETAGQPIEKRVGAAVETAAQNLPLPQYGPADVLNPETRVAALVPNLLRDVARARDPYERDTRGQRFGRTRAKIPGLRETLPVKGRNVNIAGEPTEDRSSAVRRFFTASSPEPEPMQGIPPAVSGELQRLGVSVNAPSFERTIRVGKRTVPVPPDVAERARQERRQYLVPQIERLLGSAAYRRDTDAGKKRRLQAVVERAQAAGSARSRARLIQILRTQGAFRR